MSIEVKSIKSILQSKNGIDPKQILFKKDNNFQTQIPDQIKKSYESFHKKWQDKDKNNAFKDQDSLCLSEYHIKDKKLYLNFCEEKYVLRQSISETISTLSTVEQDYFLSEINRSHIKVPISYKLNIIVITKDEKLLIVKRSNKVSTNKNRYDLGVSKGVKPEDYKGKVFQPLITALRALNEELGLTLSPKEIITNKAFKINEFYLNREIFSLGFCCVFDLRKMSGDFTFEKVSKMAAGAKNSWEYSQVLSIDLSKKAITKFMKDNLNKITNYSLYNLLQILNDL